MNKWVFFLGVFYFIIAPLISVVYQPQNHIWGLGWLWNILFGDVARDMVFGIILLLIGWVYPDKEED